MKRATLPQRLALAIALSIAVLLTACSKTVEWEEEVLLNTGQLIVIKREAELKYDISQDRLFSPYWQYQAENLNFQWNGAKYDFRSAPKEANLISVSPLILAIDSSGTPNIFGYADSYWVHLKSQGCAQTPIVKLIAQKGSWLSDSSREAWILDLTLNLTSGMLYPQPNTRVTWSEKLAQFDRWAPEARKLNPSFVIESCIKGVSK